jgi:phosphocarrier protein
MGLHVRPATSLSKLAQSFQSEIQIIKDGQTVNAKSCIDLLTLAATQGTRLVVRAEGGDAEAAVERIVRLIESGFGEE